MWDGGFRMEDMKTSRAGESADRVVGWDWAWGWGWVVWAGAARGVVSWWGWWGWWVGGGRGRSGRGGA